MYGYACLCCVNSSVLSSSSDSLLLQLELRITVKLETAWSCTLCFVTCVSVFTGRWLMSFWTGNSKIHELYTAACGLYVCWLSIRGVTVLLAWMPQGRTVILHKVQEWTLMVSISEQPPMLENTKNGQQSGAVIICLRSSPYIVYTCSVFVNWLVAYYEPISQCPKFAHKLATS